MSEKDSTSSPEAPLSPEPQKPIALTKVVETVALGRIALAKMAQTPSAVDPSASSSYMDDDLPLANEEDVSEILELTEEVGDESQPTVANAQIASHDERRGQSVIANGNPLNGTPSTPPVPKAEPDKSADAILNMIQEETQPDHQAIPRRTLTPVETPKIEISALEMLKRGREKLNKEIFPISGTIKDEANLKIIEGDLIGIMEITEDAKNSKLLSDFITGNNGVQKIEDADSPLVYAQNFRNGIYLVLKMANGELHILGKKYAEALDPIEILKKYEKLNSANDFLALSRRIEEVGKRKKAEDQKAETPEVLRGAETPEKTDTDQ